MANPMDFPFDHPDHQDETTAQQTARFAAAHPDARYVVLEVQRIAELALLIRDLQEWQEHALLTPSQENPVYARLLAVFSDPMPPMAGCAVPGSHSPHIYLSAAAGGAERTCPGRSAS